MKYALIAMMFLLLAAPALAGSPVNLGMESVSSKATEHCANMSFFFGNGCTESTIYNWKPDTWNTWFGVKDFGMSSTDAHSGSWSTAVWYQPPGACRWNETGDCGPTAYGYDGSLVQHDVTFSNTSFIVSFWAKKCAATPVQCDPADWSCAGGQYYGINGTNTGRFMFMLRDLNTSANYTFPINEANNVWSQYSVSATNINASHMFDIYWQTLALSSSQAEVDCILFDDLAINYTAAVTSPATAYIEDMTTFTNFPWVLVNYTGSYALGSDNTAQLSRKFDGVPLAKFQALQFYSTTPGTDKCLPDTLTLRYSNGYSMNVISLAAFSYGNSANKCDLTYIVFPLLNYTGLDNITISHLGNWNLTYEYTADMSVRQTYGNTLTGTETIKGNRGIYPLLSYGHVINSTFGHRFYVHNFGSQQGATSGILFERRDSDGILLDVSSGSNVIKNESATLVEAPAGWITGWNDGDYINVTVIGLANKSYSDWTETRVDFGSGTMAACASGCSGTAWYDRTISGIGCVATPTLNDPRCITPVNITLPGLGGVDYSVPLTTIDDAPWASVFLTPVFWFMVIVIAAGGATAFYTHSPHIGMAAMIGLILIFCAAGIFPFWIALLLGIGMALMLVNMFKTQIFGGGGGGG
jgi:hypothetical protein